MTIFIYLKQIYIHAHMHIYMFFYKQVAYCLQQGYYLSMASEIEFDSSNGIFPDFLDCEIDRL